MIEKNSGEDVECVRKELVRLVKPKDLQEKRGDSKVVFTFTWLLKEPMHLVLDIEKHQLVIPDILKDIPPDSSIYADLMMLTEEFSKGREELLEFSLLNKNDSVSVICKPKLDYKYGSEKILKLVNEIFQKVFENYPEYTKEKFNQIMVKIRMGGLDHGIPVILTPYREGMKKTHPYRSPGSWNLATLADSRGEYYYQQGDFFLGMVANVDNVKLPILGFVDWHDGHYKVVYPIYKELEKDGNITYHTLASFGFLDLSEVFERFQKVISIVKRYLAQIDLSHHEKRRIESWFKELPSHPIDFFKYFAARDAADFTSELLFEESNRYMGGISKKLAKIINEEDKRQMNETLGILTKIQDQRDSAASFDESLQSTIAFREAVRIAKQRDKIAKVLESNIRNISRSGGGKSVYLGKEELKWIRLGEKALVKIVEYEPFRCRVEIYPL